MMITRDAGSLRSHAARAGHGAHADQTQHRSRPTRGSGRVCSQRRGRKANGQHSAPDRVRERLLRLQPKTVARHDPAYAVDQSCLGQLTQPAVGMPVLTRLGEEQLVSSCNLRHPGGQQCLGRDGQRSRGRLRWRSGGRNGYWLGSRGWDEIMATLVLLRHGLSAWNKENRFTGWTDVDLEAMGLLWLPVEKSWRLNERHYGALEGLNKAETAVRDGADQVEAWRRSWDVRPPPVGPDDERHPSQDDRYQSVPAGSLPTGESLEDTVQRVMPFWNGSTAPALMRGERVLVAAHGNSLRGLVQIHWLSSDVTASRRCNKR